MSLSFGRLNRVSLLLGSTAAVGGGGTAILLSGTKAVPEGTAAGVAIGQLSVNEPGTWVITVDPANDAGDRVTVVANELRTTSTAFDYAVATYHDLRFNASRAADGKTISQIIRINVLDTVSLVAVTMSDITKPVTIANGGELWDLGAKITGEERTISPNDGRWVFNSDQSKVLKAGLWSVGETDVTITQTHPAAVNSPIVTTKTVTVVNPVPVVITPPWITGTGVVNSVLTGSDGTYTNSPTYFDHQWYRNGVAMAGVNGESYTPVEADIEAVIQYGVIPYNVGGPGEEVLSDGVQISAAEAPAAPKWQNTVFRLTENGSALWGSGKITDLNDADNETATILNGSPLYPAPTKPGSELDHGRTGSAVSGTSLDVSPTLAGSDVLLGGTQSWSSATGYGYQREVAPGNYQLRIAIGQSAGAGRREAVIILEGLTDVLSSSLGANPTGLGFWAASTSFVVSKMIVGTDLGIWRCTTAGVSGTTKPSGAGPTFTDGTVTWTRTARNALLVVDAVTTGAATIVDQNSALVAPNAWRASAPVPITITTTYGNGFCVLKPDGLTPYVRTVGVRSTGDPLVDLTLADDFGELEGPAPVIYARQPENFRALRIIAESGEQSPSSFSLSGTLAPYFKLTSYKGRTYLTHNGTSIPDSAAGINRTLAVTQTSAGTNHVTTFGCTVVSSGGKPTTGLLGKIVTQNWMNRKRVKDVLAADLWAGYQGQSFASDQLCTSGADFMAKFSAITPDGTSWYRLRIANARLDGQFSDTQIKDFGTGGILIEPDAGVTKMQARWNIYGLYRVVGMHIRDLHVVADKTGLTLYMIRFTDPGPTGVGGGGRFNTFKMTGCAVGPLFIEGNTPQADLSKGSFPLSMLHGRSAEVTDCDFYGSNTCYGLTGVRAMNFERNTYRCIPADIHGLSNAANPDSTQNVFADNHVYVNIADSSVWDEPDWVGYTSGAHADWVQIRTFNQNMEDWWPNSGHNGKDTNIRPWDAWVVGDTALSTDSVPRAIYRVKAVTGGGMTGPTPPMGTGSNIIDGDVTWEFVREYTTASDVFLNMENCFGSSSCPIVDGPARQWVIDSNGGSGGIAPYFGSHHCGLHISANGNLCASQSAYGITSRSPGSVNAEYNSFVGPSDMLPSAGLGAAQLRAERGSTRSRFNYTRNLSTGLKLSIDSEKVVNWTSSAVAPNRPSDLFVGTISVNANGKYTYPNFEDSLYTTHDTFVAAFKAYVGSQDPTMGVV